MINAGTCCSVNPVSPGGHLCSSSVLHTKDIIVCHTMRDIPRKINNKTFFKKTLDHFME